MVAQRLLIVVASALTVLGAGCSAGPPARHVAQAAGRANPVVMHPRPVATPGGVTLVFAG